MSLPYALLGLVNYMPATGYDLKTVFTRSIGMFWNASLPQIYRTLNQMERDGWLSSNIEHQRGKPSRKIYNITDKGKKELNRWISAPTEIQQIKNELLVKIFLGGRANQKELVKHIKEYRRRAIQFLEKAGKEAKATADDFAAKTGDKDPMRFWLLTYDFGRRRARMTIEWCDSALEVIEKGKNIEVEE
jgi:PadR family transcriptional regulator, regulatory protein AphA